MKDMGIVRGSAAQAEPLIIGKDTVYVHSNIKPVEDEEGLFEYHEIQYEKDEYIKLMAEQSNLQDNYLLDVDYRLSLVEMGVEL
jgi:hypothetical protein